MRSSSSECLSSISDAGGIPKALTSSTITPPKVSHSAALRKSGLRAFLPLSSLIEKLLVQLVTERFSFQVASEVVAEKLRLKLIREAWYVVRGVRAYDGVLQIPQRAILR